MEAGARLRGGIAGCGFFGQIQLEAWRRMPEAEIVAAADPDPARAAAAAPRAYRTVEEMLDRERLDFLDIATRPESHLPLVRLAAARRVAVICQKPMAPDWQQCREMVHAAETGGIRLMIHENWRWQPWYRAAAERIRSGAIGRPVSYYFRSRKGDGLGAAPYPAQPYFKDMARLLIYETLVHNFDTARFLFGEIGSVFAQTRRLNPVIAAEDQALVLLTHEDGMLGTVDGHRFGWPDTPPLGDAVFEGEEDVLRLAPSGDLYLGDALAWKNTVTTGYRGDSVLATQRHFIECLGSGEAFETGAQEYLKTVAVVEAAYLSAARGAPATPAELQPE